MHAETGRTWQDIDWDLISRYVAGECTPEEEVRVDVWVAAAPERRGLLDATRRVAQPMMEPPIADLRKRVLATTGIDRPTVAKVRPGAFAPPGGLAWRMVLRAAAVIAAIVGGSFAFRQLVLESPSASVPGSPRVHQIATGLGERRSLRLGDGTEVTLAPGSTIRWHADYGQRERMVELEGEAVFSVVHDSARPFAVRTDRVIARDLGTRFVVRAYRDDEVTDVVVAEGVVAVTPAAGTGPVADSLVIRRGDRARVTADGRVSLGRDVALQSYFDWTEGHLVFEGTPLREAMTRLGRWYGVHVQLDTARLAGRTVTASFRHEPASRALEFIATALDLAVEHRDSVYILRSK